MTALAPTLEAFFTSRLINEKGASAHTIAPIATPSGCCSRFAQQRTGTAAVESSRSRISTHR